MAKPVTQKIKLVSSAGTGYYYVTKKNPRNQTEKLVFKKYDPGRAQARRVQGKQDQIGRPVASATFDRQRTLRREGMVTASQGLGNRWSAETRR